MREGEAGGLGGVRSLVETKLREIEARILEGEQMKALLPTLGRVQVPRGEGV